MANQSIINAKADAVEKLAQKMSESKSYFLCEYAGLTVSQFEELRAELRKENCLVKVATNNTITRASAKLGHEELNKTEGPSCIVFSNNESVDGPKIVATFAKKNKKLKMKDGVVDGQYCTDAEIKAVAQLPSRQGLLAMLAGGLYQPLQQLAFGLNMIANPESKESTEAGAEAQA